MSEVEWNGWISETEYLQNNGWDCKIESFDYDASEKIYISKKDICFNLIGERRRGSVFEKKVFKMRDSPVSRNNQNKMIALTPENIPEILEKIVEMQNQRAPSLLKKRKIKINLFLNDLEKHIEEPDSDLEKVNNRNN